MGVGQSQQATDTLKASSTVINQAIIDAQSSSTLNCSAGSNVKFTTGKGCYFYSDGSTFNFNITVDDNCVLNSTVLTNINQQFKTQVTSALTSFIQSQANSSEGWLATAITVEVQGANTAEEIATQITNSFNDNVSVVCKEDASSSANGELDLCGVWDTSTINFNQSASTTALANCVTRTIITAFSTNSVLQELYEKTEQAVKQQSSGIDTVFIYLIVGIVVVCIVGSVLYYIVGDPSSSSGNRQSYPGRRRMPGARRMAVR